VNKNVLDRRQAICRVSGWMIGTLVIPLRSVTAAAQAPRQVEEAALRVTAVRRRYPTGLNRRFITEPAKRGEMKPDTRVLVGSTYPVSYVRPATWTLSVRVAGPPGKPFRMPANVRAYQFLVEGSNFEPIVIRRSAAAAKTARDFVEVPAGRAGPAQASRGRASGGVNARGGGGQRPSVNQGQAPSHTTEDNSREFNPEMRVKVSLAATHDDGTVARTSQSFTITDYLFAVLGDSFAAGQGNPDRKGIPQPLGELQCEATTIAKLTGGGISMAREARWLEPAAHRSTRSGHLLALQDFEDAEVGRVVTALTFATSGAEVVRGLLKPQHAWQERNGGQVAELRRTLVSAKRRLDGLVISVGGNDVGFAPAVTSMTKDRVGFFSIFGSFVSGKTRREIVAECRRLLAEMPAKYDALAEELQTLRPGAVFITEYPTGLFNNDRGQGAVGCGLFRMTGTNRSLGVSAPDARMIEAVGDDLNEVIREAAKRHGWIFVGGISTQFERHGYCADEPYWVGAEESCKSQGDLEGTLHPNSRGHEVYRARILQALRETYLRESRPRSAGVPRAI
jgi:lysophospholipase L1-like esterase